MKKEKKEVKITGYDIAYYVSIFTIIASIILAVFQFINKTDDWDKVFMFLIFGIIGYYTNKENRKKQKEKRQIEIISPKYGVHYEHSNYI